VDTLSLDTQEDWEVHDIPIPNLNTRFVISVFFSSPLKRELVKQLQSEKDSLLSIESNSKSVILIICQMLIPRFTKISPRYSLNRLF
jgi:hypothetical protein